MRDEIIMRDFLPTDCQCLLGGGKNAMKLAARVRGGDKRDAGIELECIMSL